MIYCYAERSSDGVLTTITFSDGILLFVLAIEIVFEVVHNGLGQFRKTILLHERENGCLNRCDRSRNTHHYALFAVFQSFLLKRMAEHGQYHTVHTDGGLHYVRSIVLVSLRVEILDLLSGELLVVTQVEVGSAVYAFEFLESEWEVEFDVGGRISIVSQFSWSWKR